MFSKALLIFSLISVAFATVEITTPTASTVYSGGQVDAKVEWQDDNNKPLLADFGPAIVSIYVGNTIQQTRLETLGGSVDVSKNSSIIFTVNPSIGPNGNFYFIRFESLGLKDTEGRPVEAFSHQFNLTNMSGTFSSSILSEIAGTSTAPIGGTSSAASSAATSGAASSASLTSSGTSKNPSSTSSTTSATAKPSSGAMGLKAGWAGIVFGAVVGVMF